ncbi:MAG: hypothetical protein J6N15_04075 [Ruminiclostridium sp.]|nr:hypothetical protein [Ruminiclostridium sp.]
MNRLKSEHVIEKSREAFAEVLGYDPSKESGPAPDIAKMQNINAAVNKIELSGVCGYSEQFVRFISGYNLGELPYILAGMQLTFRALYKYIPKNAPEIREMYKTVNERVKHTVYAVVGHREFPEGGDDD